MQTNEIARNTLQYQTPAEKFAQWIAAITLARRANRTPEGFRQPTLGSGGLKVGYADQAVICSDTFICYGVRNEVV